MTERTKLVVKGYSELTKSERREFIGKVQELEDADSSTDKRIIIEKINLGPINNGCPCCGK